MTQTSFLGSRSSVRPKKSLCRPNSQNAMLGLRRQLIDAVKDRARSHPESTGITLNTECESNLPLYGKVGFLKGSETDVGPLHTWSFYWPCYEAGYKDGAAGR